MSLTIEEQTKHMFKLKIVLVKKYICLQKYLLGILFHGMLEKSLLKNYTKL